MKENQEKQECVYEKENVKRKKFDDRKIIENIKEGTWLEAFTIDEYGRIITEQFKDSIFVFSSLFYKNLVKHGFESIKRWSKLVNIFGKKYIFYPIIENSHWFLIIQNNVTNQLNLLDPYVDFQDIVLKPKQRKYAKGLRIIKKIKMKK